MNNMKWIYNPKGWWGFPAIDFFINRLREFHTIVYINLDGEVHLWTSSRYPPCIQLVGIREPNRIDVGVDYESIP